MNLTRIKSIPCPFRNSEKCSLVEECYGAPRKLGNRVYTMNGLESVLDLVSKEWQPENYRVFFGFFF